MEDVYLHYNPKISLTVYIPLLLDIHEKLELITIFQDNIVKIMKIKK
jgi:hypothetical protein